MDLISKIANPSRSKKPYVMLTKNAIMGRVDGHINKLCSAIHVSRGAARILLTNFNWDVDQAMHAWSTDEELVRNVGLLQDYVFVDDEDANSSERVSKFTCPTCSSDYSRSEMMCAEYCDHWFCKDCYKSYIESKIDVCVSIVCPQSNCGAAVLDDVVETLASDDEWKKRVSSYIVRSYVQEKGNIMWCPSPGCKYAIEFKLGGKSYDVECHCSYSFCWNCRKEIHTPIDCETAKEWSELSNCYWMSADIELCPKCKNPIQNDLGGMHITCPKPCGHHFCWICLGQWKEPIGNKHSWCSTVYIAGIGSRGNRAEAARVLERYKHYCDRLELNQSLKEKAEGNLKDWKKKNEKKRTKDELLKRDLVFVKDAWLQIIRWTRVLKWSYVHGFYMSEEENGNKRIFEFWQEEAQTSLERLHQCAVKGLDLDSKDYLNCGGENHNFKKVIALAKATTTSFAGLFNALGSGVEDSGSDDDGLDLDAERLTNLSIA